MTELPKYNDLIAIEFGFGKTTWNVAAVGEKSVLVGSRSWLKKDYLWMGIKELNSRNAEIVGRCKRFLCFCFYFLGK